MMIGIIITVSVVLIAMIAHAFAAAGWPVAVGFIAGFLVCYIGYGVHRRPEENRAVS